MYLGKCVAVIIPALNEQEAIPLVVAAIPRSLADHIIVVDNGSRDDTVATARRAGASVVTEPQRGYGAACLRGLREVQRRRVDIVVFLDGDFSDQPQEMTRLIDPIGRGEAELVIGSRIHHAEPGALLPQARFGNVLATGLMRLLFGHRYTDLGPFRAITKPALERLQMRDRNFGWTVEMQVKAVRLGLRVVEVPVSYRRRLGVSKISGSMSGVVQAGWKIVTTIVRLRLQPLRWLESGAQ